MKITTTLHKKQTVLANKTEEKAKEESNWSKLINGIIRPPRSKYKEVSLGAKEFTLNESKYRRKDMQIKHQDKLLTLTIYQPENINHWLLLYLHGNSSSRLESTSIIKFLPRGFSLASFDFIGCGQNHQDDVISLGVRESEQAKTIVDFLENSRFRVLLWGRSMGAATALKFGQVKAIVADSSFRSFKSLCKEIAKSNSPCYVPNCMISCFFPCVFSKLRSDIQEKGHYDIEQLDICEDVKKINKDTLIIFMSGDQDKLIDKANSQKLYNSFPGKNKYLQIFKGNHNTKRPDETLRKVMGYISAFVVDYDIQQKQIASRTRIDVNVED